MWRQTNTVGMAVTDLWLLFALNLLLQQWRELIVNNYFLAPLVLEASVHPFTILVLVHLVQLMFLVQLMVEAAVDLDRTLILWLEQLRVEAQAKYTLQLHVVMPTDFQLI